MSIATSPLLRLSGWALLLTLPLMTGCALDKGIAPLPRDMEQVCRAVSGQGQRHVYVFMVDGADVLDLSGMHKLKKYLHSLGFTKIWLGHRHHEGKLTEIIREVHLQDPQAQFVLLAHRRGAEPARNIARNLGACGVAFELLAYLGGSHLDNESGYRPQNVMKVLYYRGGWQLCQGQPLAQAENETLMDADTMEVPTHPEVVERIVYELTRIAGSVEVPIPLPRLHELREGPTPFPVKPPVEGPAPDEWDFLKPTLDR